MNDARTTVWNSLLDVDMNQRYYGHLCRRYSRREMVLKILVAASSSVSIASWKLWSQTTGWMDWSRAWQVLTALSAIMAVAMPILNLAKTAQRAADLRGKYAALLVDYESLWLQVDALQDDAIRKRFVALRQKESELATSEADMPHNKRLILSCQNEIEKGRGLK